MDDISFWEQIFLTWEQNFALVLLPILALLVVIAILIYYIWRYKQRSELNALRMRHAIQHAKILAPRVRIKLKPFVGQGSQWFWKAGRGANIIDIQGMMYLLREDQYEENGQVYRQDTAAIVNWRQGRFAVFRVSHLDPKASLLSRLGYKPWRKIAIMSLGILWIIILGQIVYEIMITFAIFQEQEPTFLFDPGIFGWYAAFGLLIASWFLIEQVKDGFYADCWYVDVTEEDIIIDMGRMLAGQDSKSFTLPQIEVYTIYRLYHDFVSPADLLDGITARSIATYIQESEKRQIAELSADITNLRTKTEQLEKQLSLKQIEMSELKDRLEEVKMEGVAEGIKLAHRNVDILSPSRALLNSEGFISLLKLAIPGGILAFIAFLVLSQGPTFLSELSLDPGIFVILLLVGVGFILFAGVLFILSIRELLRGGGARLT